MKNPDFSEPDSDARQEISPYEYTRRTILSLIAGFAGALALSNSVLAKSRHGAEPYIGAEVIENARPYIAVLPSAPRDEIFRTFMNLSADRATEIATSSNISYNTRFPHLYADGRTVPVDIIPNHVRRKLRRFQAVWERQLDSRFYMTRCIFIGTQDDAPIYAMDFSKFIDPDDPFIKNLARQIIAGIEEPEDQLQAILYFVQQFPYKKDSGDVEIPAFPQAGLARHVMDCEDKVILAVSLAASIPSVKQLGLAIIYTRIDEKQEGHVLLGVGGRREKYKIPSMQEPKQYKDWYLVDTAMLGSFPGYLMRNLEESAIRHVQPIS